MVTTRSFLTETLRPHRWTVALIVALSVLASLFDGLSIAILVPLLARLQLVESSESAVPFGQLVGAFAHLSPLAQVYWAIGLVVLLSVCKNGFTAVAIRMGHGLSARLLADLRMRAMTVLLTAGLAFHQRSRIGDLIDQTISGTFTAEGLIRLGIEFAANILTLLVLLTVLVLLSWQLALVVVPVGLLFGWWMRRHTRVLRRLSHEVADVNQSVVGSVHEALAGISLIKAYSQEGRHLAKLGGIVEASRRLEARRRFRMFWIHPATDMAGTFAMALLVVVALQSSTVGTRLVLATLLPFLYVLLRTVPLMKVLNGLRAELITHWAQVGRLRDLLHVDDKDRLVDGTRPFAGLRDAIELRRVTFRYDSAARPALEDVTIRIPAGRTTAIVGESGSGKSTVASLLLRLYDPSEGQVVIDGIPLQEFQLASYHASVGIVSQDTFLFNDSVGENIRFGAADEVSREQIVAAAMRAGAHEFIEAMAEGYDTVLGDRGVRLSGGQRQRIALARAIIRDPSILILDEATSALDDGTEARILDALRAFSQDRTVVIIAHRMSTIAHADWLIEFGNGRVIRQVSAERVLGVSAGADYPAGQ